jgi:hypothetical protein
MAISRLCSIPNCGKGGRITRGLCSAHYHRLCRHGDPLGGGTSHGDLLAWITAHASYEGDDCLKWPFNDHPAGPGATYIDGKKVKVTRVMCELAHGPAPSPDHEAAHSCGKAHEGCIHPGHLRWDTHKGNHEDRIDHDTANRGETNGQARLTSDDVLAIRAMSEDFTQTVIAAKFGVSRQTISDIQRRRRWHWL